MPRVTVTQFQPQFRLTVSSDSAKLSPRLSLLPSLQSRPPPRITLHRPHMRTYNARTIATRIHVDAVHRVPQPWGVVIKLTPMWNSVRDTKTLFIRHPRPQSHPRIEHLPHFLWTTHQVAFFRPVCRILCSPHPCHPPQLHPLICRLMSTSQVPFPFIRQVARSHTQMATASQVYIARHLPSA